MQTATNPRMTREEAITAIEAKAFAPDSCGCWFCRFCGILQPAWRDEPSHADDCPIQILKEKEVNTRWQ